MPCLCESFLSQTSIWFAWLFRNLYIASDPGLSLVIHFLFHFWSVKYYFRFTRLSSTIHGRNQDFFREGNTFSKKIYKKFIKFLKNFVKIYKKFSKIFNKITKKIVKKIAKNGFFSLFFEKFNKPSIPFLRVWTKNAICTKFLRTFTKIF